MSLRPQKPRISWSGSPSRRKPHGESLARGRTVVNINSYRRVFLSNRINFPNFCSFVVYKILDSNLVAIAVAFSGQIKLPSESVNNRVLPIRKAARGGDPLVSLREPNNAPVGQFG